MPDAEGPPKLDLPPVMRMGGQYDSDAEIVQTIAEVLLKAGHGDLAENAEAISRRMQAIYKDCLFGINDATLDRFAQYAVQKLTDSLQMRPLNHTNRYLAVREMMDTWREFLLEAGIPSIEMTERNRLLCWVRDLHSGMYVNCVYCGHRYGPYGEKPAQQALTEHVENCVEHPLYKAKLRITELEQRIEQLKADHDSKK